MRVALFLLVVAGSSNACLPAITRSGTVASCVEEEGAGRLPSDSRGRTLAVVGDVVGDSGFATRGSCTQTGETEAVTVDDTDLADDGNPIGKVRFSWGAHDLDLHVAFADGSLTIDPLTPAAFSGGTSFAIHDADGLAFAIDTDGFMRRFDDVAIDFGVSRGTSLTDCGTLTAKAVLIKVGSEEAEADVGTEELVTIGQHDFTFHVFSAFQLGDGWQCTDSADTITWSLTRR